MPLLHFLLLGVVLYSTQRLLPQDLISPAEPIRITSDDVQQIRNQLRQDTAKEPTTAQLEASLRRHVDEEILLREALRLGLDSSDKVARQRQIKNMRFAFPESKDDDETLMRAAKRLHMAERDMVVRNRLVQQMGQRLSSSVTLSDAEMRDYLARHPDRYDAAARYSFKQVFFSEDVAASNVRASAVLATLRTGDASAANQGDSFLLGREFRDLSEEDISRLLGDAFAKAVSQTPAGAWSQPIASAYGLHLVFIEKQSSAQHADFAGLRTRIAYALLAEKEDGAVRAALPALRARYGVESIAMNGVTR